MTDEELFTQLQLHGISAGPIVDSTRSLYQRKLLAVLNHSPASEPAAEAEQTNGNGHSEAYEQEERFSDSEGEQEAAQHNIAGEPEVVKVVETVEEPAVVKDAAPQIILTSPEPLTAIRKRVAADRSGSSLNALPLVDRQVISLI